MLSKAKSRKRNPLKRWLATFTWRKTALWAAACVILGYPFYLSLYTLITGGITHEGNLAVVDLKSMSSFDMNQLTGVTDNIPPRFRALDGKRVRLVGQMYSPNISGGKVRRFVLVYSINSCCFNGPPLVQHYVQATVPDNQDIQLTDGYVEVTGILHVGVERSAGAIQSVYRVDVDGVHATD